jgi:hypothetical protein
LADSYSQSINSIPKNITYFYGDDNLESTRGPRFQVDSINERLGVVDITPSKTPKTLQDRYIEDLSLIRLPTSLDLERVHCLSQRCIPNILLILLELDFSEAQGTEDPKTHRSLWSDRPYLSLAVHSSSDINWVIATEILIPIWVLVFHGTPDRLRVISVS